MIRREYDIRDLQRRMLDYEREAEPLIAFLVRLSLMQRTSIVICGDSCEFIEHWSPEADRMRATVEDGLRYLRRHFFPESFNVV
jgi:hypothetical protein